MGTFHTRGVLAAAIVTSVVIQVASAQDLPNRLSGGVASYTAQPGDTLVEVSARFGIDEAVIRRDNRMAPGAILLAGRTLLLDNRHIVPSSLADESIVINVPQRMLFSFESEALAGAFPIAVGRRSWPTPAGPFEVLSKESDPTWDVPLSIQEEMKRQGKPVVTSMPPGADNPLGRHWIGLTLRNIGIHGTPLLTSVYRAVSHGCIRMHPDDVAILFAGIQMGASGRVVYEPVLLAAVDGAIFLEAHRNIYGHAAVDVRIRLRELEAAGAWIDWNAVEHALDSREGIARQVGVREETRAR